MSEKTFQSSTAPRCCFFIRSSRLPCVFACQATQAVSAYLEKFYAYAHSIEEEKLFYFSLVYRQTTVIISAPADNKEQKEFLGYDWSNRKGNEGIQIITPGGKMYDDADREASGTLAYAINQSFKALHLQFQAEKCRIKPSQR